MSYKVYVKEPPVNAKGKGKAKPKKPAEEYMEVELPPVFRTLPPRVLDIINEVPLDFKFQCHSQATEHGVALTTESIGKRRKHESRLGVALSTDVARKKYSSKIPHKKYGE